MDLEILLLLVQDSFFAGIVIFFDAGEIILPAMLDYPEVYDLKIMYVVAYVVNSFALLINWGVLKSLVSWLGSQSSSFEEFTKKFDDSKRNLFTLSLWPVVFFAPFGGGGAAALSLAGLFKLSYKKAVPSVLITNAGYYAALSHDVVSVYLQVTAVTVVLFLIFNGVTLFLKRAD